MLSVKLLFQSGPYKGTNNELIRREGSWMSIMRDDELLPELLEI